MASTWNLSLLLHDRETSFIILLGGRLETKKEYRLVYHKSSCEAEQNAYKFLQYTTLKKKKGHFRLYLDNTLIITAENLWASVLSGNMHIFSTSADDKNLAKLDWVTCISSKKWGWWVRKEEGNFCCLFTEVVFTCHQQFNTWSSAQCSQ